MPKSVFYSDKCIMKTIENMIGQTEAVNRTTRQKQGSKKHTSKPSVKRTPLQSIKILMVYQWHHRAQNVVT